MILPERGYETKQVYCCSSPVTTAPTALRRMCILEISFPEASQDTTRVFCRWQQAPIYIYTHNIIVSLNSIIIIITVQEISRTVGGQGGRQHVNFVCRLLFGTIRPVLTPGPILIYYIQRYVHIIIYSIHGRTRCGQEMRFEPHLITTPKTSRFLAFHISPPPNPTLTRRPSTSRPFVIDIMLETPRPSDRDRAV